MLLSTGAERFLNGAPDLHGVDRALAATRTRGRHSGRPGRVIEEIPTPTVDRPNPGFVAASGADRDLVLNPLRVRASTAGPVFVWGKDLLRDDFTRALAMQPAEDRNQELAALLKRFLPCREVLGCQSRSPGLSLRWAASALSAAVVAAYRPTIARELHPARRIRSVSSPPLANQVWANQ